MERTPLLARGNASEVTLASSFEDDGVAYSHKSWQSDLPSGPSHLDLLRYYVPICRWLPNYKLKHLHHDIAAGLSVACLSIPQSLSYARSLAQVTAAHGLYAASIPGFIYAVFGTSRQLSMGPEAAGSLLIGQTISRLCLSVPAEERAAMAVALTTIIAFQIGLLTFLLGLFRFGFLESLYSRPLIRGFLSAMALVIFVEQLVPFCGLQGVASQANFHRASSAQKLGLVVAHFGDRHKLNFRLAVISFASLLNYRLIKPWLVKKCRAVQYIPDVLLLVLCTTLITSLKRWDLKGLVILGSVDSQLGQIGNPLRFWSYAADTFPTALVLAMVGYVETIVTGKQLAARFKHSVSANRELVAVGLINLANSCVTGTLPAFGSVTRSRVNADTGARTPLAALITASTVLLSIHCLLPYLYFLPAAVMSTITMAVVVRLLGELPHDLAFFTRMRAWRELGLMSVTFVLTFFWSVHAGILIGTLISLGRVVQNSSSIFTEALDSESLPAASPPLKAVEPYSLRDPGLLVARFAHHLTFANAGAIKEQLGRLERYGTTRMHPGTPSQRLPPKKLVLEMSDVASIDACAAQVLLETVSGYLESSTDIRIVGLSPTCHQVLDRAGIPQVALEQPHLPP